MDWVRLWPRLERPRLAMGANHAKVYEAPAGFVPQQSAAVLQRQFDDCIPVYRGDVPAPMASAMRRSDGRMSPTPLDPSFVLKTSRYEFVVGSSPEENAAHHYLVSLGE